MLNAVLLPRLRRDAIALALPVFIASGDRFPLKDIAIEGSLRSRELEGTVTTAVASPIGRLPVAGRVFARHACDGRFAGTVSYPAWVRLAARLKRVRLVTALDGRLHEADTSSCAVATETLSGQFRLADSVLIGDLKTGQTAWVVLGIVRAIGDSTYHAELTTATAARPATVSLFLYQR